MREFAEDAGSEPLPRLRYAEAVYCARRDLLMLAVAAPMGALLASRARAAEIRFRDVAAQSRQFMGWYGAIQLTPAQERVKKAALEPIPAPCCSDNSAYTCCCTCNISRTVWGLSHYLIARQGATAEQVRAKVEEWIAFIGPNGYSGKACYSRGCSRPFHQDGCGGMRADELIL